MQSAFSGIAIRRALGSARKPLDSELLVPKEKRARQLATPVSFEQYRSGSDAALARDTQADQAEAQQHERCRFGHGSRHKLVVAGK